MKVCEAVKKARQVGVPILAISTADQAATVAAVCGGFNGDLPVLIRHDVVRGMVALSEAASRVVADLCGGSDPSIVTGNPVEALRLAEKLPERSVLFMLNGHLLLKDAGGAPNVGVVQAICNLRDQFKSDGRTVVLLGPSFALPAELVQDVFSVDEALPERAEIQAIISELVQSAELEASEADLERGADALAGLSAFAAEQAAAMALSPAGLSVAECWSRKRRFIEQTPGLGVDAGSLTFDQLGGLENAKDFGRALFAGRDAPKCVVRVDEIEKLMAGVSGDTSGVSQDQLGALLRALEDYGWSGMIAVGPPGSGKTAYSQALGASHGVPTISVDLGAAKGSLVGQSEERIRTLVKMVQAIAGSGAFWVATCNKLDVLPPELRRRFCEGIWFFDLPDKEEGGRIWDLCLKRFELADDWPWLNPAAWAGWTGAEIRNVCRLAWRLSIPLSEAARFIVPVVQADPEAVERLRRAAAGRFVSASYPGAYRMPGDTVPKVRRLNVKGGE